MALLEVFGALLGAQLTDFFSSFGLLALINAALKVPIPRENCRNG